MFQLLKPVSFNLELKKKSIKMQKVKWKTSKYLNLLCFYWSEENQNVGYFHFIFLLNFKSIKKKIKRSEGLTWERMKKALLNEWLNRWREDWSKEQTNEQTKEWTN